MAERFVGKGTVSDLAAEMAAAEQAQGRLNSKLRERGVLEEDIGSVERQGATTRQQLAGVTDELASAISRSADSLTREITAITASTEAWRANAIARKEALGVGAGGGTGGTFWVPSTATEGAPAAAAAAGGGGGGGGGRRPTMVPAGGAGEEPRRSMAEYTRQVEANDQAVRHLSATQGEANLRFQAAAASYSDSSLALSRHGALTTEFIQAFSRGQVTMQEFGSQMTNTMGKFGGWVVAGAAIYGVFDALKHVTEGATETQGAIQNLGRFLPGLGGPAGGGSGQIPAAEGQIRDISQQFNLPIKDVSEAMQNMARTFKTVPDTAAATRAVLAATRLDQVPLNQAQQYLTGISHAEGWWNPGQGQNLIGVMDQLNAIQAQYGARVSETLPAVARAAPVAQAYNLPINDLEALSGMGVRAGISGNQVGTALFRSMSNFAFRPTSEVAYREFGVTPQYGQFGGLMSDVMNQIYQRTRAGDAPAGTELRNLAVAIGGPLQSRNILPMLMQQELGAREGKNIYNEMRTPTNRSFQEDLDAALGSISEKFKSLGINLENLGSQLFSAGLMTPITALVDGLSTLSKVVTTAISPFTSVLSIFMRLPEALRDVIGAFLLIKGANALYNSSVGATARGFAAHIPGMESVRDEPRAVVGGYVSRMETGIRPLLEGELDTATRNRSLAEMQVQRTRATMSQFATENAALLAGPRTPESEAAHDKLSGHKAQVTSSESAANAAMEKEVGIAKQLAELDEQIRIMKSDYLSWQTRATYAMKLGAVADEKLATVKEETIVATQAAFAETMGMAAPAQKQSRFARAPAPSVAEGGVPVVVPAPEMTRAASTAAREAVAAVTRPVFTPNMTTRERASAAYGATENVAMTQLANLRSRAQEMGSETRDWFRDRYTGASGFGGYAGRTAQMAREQFAGAAASPWTPMVGMIGAQMLGGAIGSNTLGNFVSGPVGSGFTGMMLAQMMGKNLGVGYLAGQTLGSFQQGTGQGVGSVVGTGVGAALGSLVGMPMVGAIAGNTLGSLVGGLFGGGPPPSADDLAKRAKQKSDQLLGSPDISTQVRSAFEVQSQTPDGLNDKALSDAQVQARQTVQSAMQTLVTQLSVFGEGSKAGKDAASKLNQATRAAVGAGASDPATAQQVMQAAAQRNTMIQAQFTYMSQTGQSGAAMQAAQKYAQIQSGYDAGVSDAQKELSDARVQYGQALKTGRQSLINSAQKGVEAAEKGYEFAKGAQAQYTQTAKLQNQQNFAAEYQQAAGLVQAQATYDAASAGGNRAGQIRAAMRGISGQQSALAERAANMDPTVVKQTQLQLEAQKEQARTQMTQLGLTEMQSRGAVTGARVPTYDTVGQASARLKEVQREYDYMKQNSKAFDPADINNALASVISAKQAVADAAAQYASQMAQANAQLKSAQDVGDTVAQANDNLQAALTTLKTARGPLAKQQARGQVAAQRNAVYEAVTARQDTAYQIAGIAATGDALAQAHYQTQQGYYDLSRARGVDEQQAARREIGQGQVAEHSAAMQRISETTALQAAADQGSPVAVARDNLRGAQQTLAAARGFDEITQARAGVLNAEYALHTALQAKVQADAALAQSLHPGDAVGQAQYAVDAAKKVLAMAQTESEREAAETQLHQADQQLHMARQARIQATGALHEAQQSGNSVLQAQTQVNNDQRVLRNAVGPDEQRAARTALANDTWRLHQAQMSRISAQGGLAQARDWGDSVGQAEEGLTTARRELRNARGPDERTQAQTQVAQAEAQLHQANMQRTQALGQLAASMHPGDSVGQAQATLAAARALLASAHGVDEQVQAQIQYNSAQAQLHQALMQQIAAVGELQASYTRDPLQQLAARINAARAALAAATGPDEVMQAQTQLNNLQNEYESQVISQTESTIDFQLQMKQITAQQAIAQLKSLEATSNLTTQERQQVELRIRQLQLGGGSGQFNLAPGNIKMPTIYDVRRGVDATVAAIAGAQLSSLGAQRGSFKANMQTQINVYVNSQADLPAVADALDRATTGQLAARLRAAGVLGG